MSLKHHRRRCERLLIDHVRDRHDRAALRDVYSLAIRSGTLEALHNLRVEMRNWINCRVRADYEDAHSSSRKLASIASSTMSHW